MKEIIDKIMKRIAEKREYYYLNDDVYDIIAVDALDFACDVIEEEVKKYNNGWIPCSERLPKHMERCLVSLENEVVCQAVYAVDEFINILGSFSENNKVLAWQPLPPAYSETN